MRTKATPVIFLLGALMFGFFFHLGERQAAADPACSVWACNDAYGWWTSEVTLSAERTGAVAPLQGTDHRTHAIPQVYVPSSLGTTPRYTDGSTIDRWQWTSYTPSCAKVGGVDPAPQVVTPGAPSIGTPATITRYFCTSTAP
jgi:hypothetical protein